MTDNDIKIFLNNKYNQLMDNNESNDHIQYLDFYKGVEKEELRYLFAYFQSKLNQLLSFMNNKFNTNGHYNATESRELLKVIDDVKKLLKIVQQYKIDDTYSKIIDMCLTFLSSSGGSSIPENYEVLEIVDYKGIFESTTTVKTSGGIKQYQLKNIGSGSYAEVFKYKDEQYNKHFALKKAKKELSTKELERFKREFEEMRKLNSPYILEVYSFDNEKYAYTMEYADATLYEYVYENNTKLSIQERKQIINQIFKAFQYIHDKLGLHRDISSTNILLRFYDDLPVIKVSDFGLVKLKDSNLTSDDTDFKGSLNDPQLNIKGGFKNYSIEHETYALTRLLYFVMTGKKIIDQFSNKSFEEFINKGISQNSVDRYASVEEMRRSFNTIVF